MNADDALLEYRQSRFNDLDEHPAFEQGRSYLRGYADAAIGALVAELGELEAELAKLEAEVERLREQYGVAVNASEDFEAQLVAVVADNERLKVCGNCVHSIWPDGVGSCMKGRVWDLHPKDDCAFTPSRWTARED